jgi:hypothetical protein
MKNTATQPSGRRGGAGAWVSWSSSTGRTRSPVRVVQYAHRELVAREPQLPVAVVQLLGASEQVRFGLVEPSL